MPDHNQRESSLPVIAFRVIAGIIIALVIWAAYSAMARLKMRGEEHLVRVNLQFFKSEAQLYMLDNDVEYVTSEDILGGDKPILRLEQVADETYDFTVYTNTTRITTTMRGRVIYYDF